MQYKHIVAATVAFTLLAGCDDTSNRALPQPPAEQYDAALSTSQTDTDSSMPAYDTAATGCEAVGLVVQEARAIDGDTFAFMCEKQEIRFRLAGVSAIEMNQKTEPCKARAADSREALQALLASGEVRVFPPNGKDAFEKSYGRLVGHIWVDGKDGIRLLLKKESLGLNEAYRQNWNEGWPQGRGAEGCYER